MAQLSHIDPAARRLGLVAAIAVGVLAVLWVYPLVWIFGLSFRTDEALMAGTGGLIRFPLTLENYLDLSVQAQVPRWFLNSIIVTSISTVLVLVLSTLAGYAFARIDFRGRKYVFIFVLAGITVPEQAIFIPLHTMFAGWDLHNTYSALILPKLAPPFGVFLMTQFFRAVPRELEEAALVDNASHLKIFLRIFLPLSLPALATLGIFTFLGVWNDFLWPLVSATDAEMFTLTVGMASVKTQFGLTDQLGFSMASTIAASVPLIVVFIIFQKYLVRGIAMNAGK